MDDETGILAVGGKADLDVLDSHLFGLDAVGIHNMKVLITVIDGNIVYTATP